VKSRTTIQFRQAFAKLPEQVQTQTRPAYRQFKKNPGHQSLRFKKGAKAADCRSTYADQTTDLIHNVMDKILFLLMMIIL
jgi:hypothetical protein